MPSTPRRFVRFAATFLLPALLLLSSYVAWGGAGDFGITVTTTVQVTDLDSGQIPLAELVTGSAADAPVAFGLAWRLEPDAYFPTWELQLTSEVPELLPTGTAVAVLSRSVPVPGHTYQVTLSYSWAMNVVAMRVYDITDDLVVYANALAVAPFAGGLQATHGKASPYYTPVGTSWTPGVMTDDGRFIPSSHFDTRDHDAYLRVTSRGPLPPGEYHIFLEHDGDEQLLATLTPTAQPVLLPLPLDELPLGPTHVRVEYVDGEETVPHDHRTITLGRIEVQVHPVTTDRDEGVVRTTLNIQAAAPYPDELGFTLTASVLEMVWDSSSRIFVEVPHGERMLIFSDALDLASGSIQLEVDVPLPDSPGNWRLELGMEPSPAVSQQVEGNTRVFSTHAPATIGLGESYTFIIFPDTQYFAQDHPHIFTRMTDWVTANAAHMNIAAVLHMGDITNNNAHAEWKNAFTSLSLLHDVVPYVLALGNHDMTRSGGQVAQRGLTLINDYFSVEAAARYSNLAGTMTEGSLENHYSLLSVAGDNYLIISLEFGPPDEALVWANQVADQYPDHRLIVITHSYLSRNAVDSTSPHTYPLASNSATTVNAAPEIWPTLLRDRANSFMVLSGHTSPPAPVIPHRARRATPGQPVFDLLFDFQSEPNGGNGWLGILTFYPDSNTAEAWVFSPYLGEYANARTSNGYTSHILMNLETGSVRRLLE